MKSRHVGVRSHPGRPASLVRAAISQLIRAGYIEDAGAPDPAGLSERDKERYDRARGYYRWLDLTSRESTWDPQVRLGRASVTVAGAIFAPASFAGRAGSVM